MRHLFIIIFSIAILSAKDGFASHPLITDDAGTVGKGGIQIEINGEVGTDKESIDGVTTKTDSSQISTTFGYGLTDKLDLNFGIARPFGSVDVDGVKSNDPGSVDLSLNTKWQIYQTNGFSVALKPAIGYSYGVNQPENDYTVSYSAAVILTKEIEPLAFHLNLAYTYNDYNLDSVSATKRNSIYSASVAAVYDLFKKSKLVADIGGSSNEERISDKIPVYALIGTIYSLTNYLDASIGGKIGVTSAETDFTGLFGVTLKF